MAKDPAFLFYSSDFLAGVQDLTMEERGQYISLLCMQHQKGHLTEKMIRLCCGNATADVMAKFRQDSGGSYFNERLDEEIKKRLAHTEKQRERALNGWEKRKKDTGAHTTADAVAMPLENENENITVFKNINIPFDVFWNLYEKKVGDKTKLEKKWQALSDHDREAIIAHIPKYKIAQPDKKYRKDPQTYLNNKSWNDEIIPSANGTHKPTITKNNAGAYQLLQSYNDDTRAYRG